MQNTRSNSIHYIGECGVLGNELNNNMKEAFFIEKKRDKLEAT